MLSSLYRDWVSQLLAGPLPAETKATCDNCAMLPQPTTGPGAIVFNPDTRCCTYEPALPNYRVGLILSDENADLADGRRTVEERMRTPSLTTPWGLHVSTTRFNRLYKYRANGFGRDATVTCPHFIEGRCGIWRHSPSRCSTWFCKHDRGATGWYFWNELDQLLREIDKGIGLWCAAELQIDARRLEALLQGPGTLDAEAEPGRHLGLWGDWVGREAEFYKACAERVQSLGWDDLVRICGTSLVDHSKLVLAAYTAVTSQAIPEHPLMGLVRIEGLDAAKHSVLTYSLYDPLRMSPELFDVLQHFDGRPTGEVLEEIRIERGVVLERGPGPPDG